LQTIRHHFNIFANSFVFLALKQGIANSLHLSA